MEKKQIFSIAELTDKLRQSRIAMSDRRQLAEAQEMRAHHARILRANGSGRIAG